MANPSHVEWTYGMLLAAFADVKRSNDKEKSERIFAAIEVFQELWPEDTKRWQERIRSKEGK